ncbi:MAG: hypothetical protein HOM88_05120 [Hellea sp.]|nr:hypothetical protein [Hellea sp.]
MAFSVSPSVIVREIDASAVVPAISTPPAAIAGIFNWGPVNEPILISAETQLADRFGKPNDGNYETWFTAADFLAYSNALWVVRADDSSNTAANTIFTAKYPGELGDSLSVAYCSAGGFGNVEIVAGDIPTNKISNPAVKQTIEFGAKTVTFEVVPADRITSVTVGDVLTVGNDSVGYQNLSVASVAESEIIEANTTTGYAYTMAFDNSYTLAATSLPTISMETKWAYNSLFNGAPDANHIHVAVIDSTGDISGKANTILETFENLSTANNATRADGTLKYFDTVIENGSSWINVANTAAIGTANTSLTVYETMAGGSNATDEANTTLAAIGGAYDQFTNTNEIDISSILVGKSDDAGTHASYIMSNIVDVRKDCVMYVSPSKLAAVDENKPNAKMTKIIEHKNKISPLNSYMFMDSGYKYRYDKYNDQYRWVPLNGDMAGLASRVEVWESPAGFRKGLIKNVVKLAFNPSKAQRDQLYSHGINPVMSQIGQGVLLFGDKTSQTFASAFDRLNVRRLFIAVEKAIATAAEGFLFELNDEFTQTQFKNIVDPFLRDIQGRRGIIDYRVISDSTVNTPEIVDQNKFRASIFIKPARSINVIELTFIATRTGIEFDEIVGQLT